MANDALFRSKAPGIMRQLIADFDLGDNPASEIEGAAAILGNIGHECGGFHLFQEQNPTVSGSRGGFGWCQWTGPRRRAFEAYIKRNNLDPKSDKANYGWLFVELTSTEKASIPAVKAARGLEDKTRAFEAKFERAGIKHYERRYEWARIALDALKAAGEGPVPPPPPIPSPPPPVTNEGRNIGIAAVITFALTSLFGFIVYMFGG